MMSDIWIVFVYFWRAIMLPVIVVNAAERNWVDVAAGVGSLLCAWSVSTEGKRA